MKERPILFNAPMVRAILAGKKTQTRRIAKPVRHPDLGNIYTPGALVLEHEPQHVIERACPYGRPGDQLWVRETWGYNPDHPGMAWHVCYRADPGHEHDGIKWKPSIHMPRAACRIKLEVTSVRIERLQDGDGEVSWESRYLAEGIHKIDHGRGDHYYSAFRKEPHPENWADPFDAWRELWSSTGGEWKANPWVLVVEFRRIK